MFLWCYSWWDLMLFGCYHTSLCGDLMLIGRYHTSLCGISWWVVMLFGAVTNFAFEMSCLFDRYAMSCFFGPLQALRLRCHAWSFIVWCKDAGDWAYRMIYSTLGGLLAGEMSVSFVVAVGASLCLCGSCLIRVTKCIISSRYVDLNMLLWFKSMFTQGFGSVA